MCSVCVVLVNFLTVAVSLSKLPSCSFRVREADCGYTNSLLREKRTKIQCYTPLKKKYTDQLEAFRSFIH